MKALHVIAILAVLGILTAAAFAQTPAPASRPALDGKTMAERGQMVMDRLVKELGLTGDQAAKVKDIWMAHMDQVVAWHKANGEQLKAAEDALHKAAESRDSNSMKAAQQLQKVLESRKTIHEDLMKQLGTVLSADQIAKAKEMLRPRPGGPGMRAAFALHQLDLTDAQRQQVHTIMSAARDKAKDANDPAEKGKILQGAIEKVKTDVLTPEQRQKLETMHQQGPGGRHPLLEALNLTDDQKAKVKAIMEDAHTKAAAAKTPEEKRTIMQAAMKKVRDDVLTDAQRKLLQEKREQFRGNLQERPRERRGGPATQTVPATN